MRPCHYAGCHNLSRDTYCPDHKALHEQELKDSIRGGYSGKPYGSKWDKLSRKLRHDEPVCRMCKIRASRTVDHIVPKSRGGTDDRNNLQPLCLPCTAEKNKADRLKKY
jgi:5-methylcytosine-specific restriction protein A